MVDAAAIGHSEALEVVAALEAECRARGAPIGDPVVLVGGSAMAAHGLRQRSVDVDLFVGSASDDAVNAVERRLRTRFGPAFRLDVTTGENLWGILLLRDLATSPIVGTIETPDGRRPLRALRPEDLFFLKLLADRPKDREDIPLIAKVLSVEAVTARFAEVLPWLGNRSAVLGFADAVIRSLVEHLGADGRQLARTLRVSEHVRAELIDTWDDDGRG
jgi:hypothetical protein